jgi:hypothetical protein
MFIAEIQLVGRPELGSLATVQLTVMSFFPPRLTVVACVAKVKVVCIAEFEATGVAEWDTKGEAVGVAKFAAECATGAAITSGVYAENIDIPARYAANVLDFIHDSPFKTIDARQLSQVTQGAKKMQMSLCEGARVREWRGNGAGMEREWSGNGAGMEREWNGNGTGRDGFLPTVADPSLYIDISRENPC